MEVTTPYGKREVETRPWNKAVLRPMSILISLKAAFESTAGPRMTMMTQTVTESWVAFRQLCVVPYPMVVDCYPRLGVLYL